MEVGQARSVLGLEPGDPPDRILMSFRRQALAQHPDRGGDPDKFRAVLDARDLLLGVASTAPLTTASSGAATIRFSRTPTHREALRALLSRLAQAALDARRRTGPG